MAKNTVYGILNEKEYLNIKNILSKSDTENLRILYSVQSEWIRHYNNMSWGIGAVLVPLSFSGFALTFQSDKNPIFFVAIASIFLLICWQLIISWQRRLWKRCLSLTSIIEEIWDIREKSFETTTALLFKSIGKKDYGASIRLLIVCIGSLLWIFRIFVELKLF